MQFRQLLLALTLSLSSIAHALPELLVFSGRWDLRSPEHAITVNSGSYVKARFEGTGIIAAFDTSANKPAFPTISWKIDDGDWQDAEIAGTVILAEKLCQGTHDLMLMVRGWDQSQNRWAQPLAASMTLTDIRPINGKLLTVSPEKGPKLEFLGDSITEGIRVHGEKPMKTTPWAWISDGRLSYAAQTAKELQAQWRLVGFGGQGVTHGGIGGVPSAAESFQFFYKDCPRDNWQPDAVIINEGTNDDEKNVSPEKFKPAYTNYLNVIRAAYPKAKIVALIPFCAHQAESIRAVVAERNQGGDNRCYLIDASKWLKGPDFTDGWHPNIEGSKNAAQCLVPELQAILAK